MRPTRELSGAGHRKRINALTSIVATVDGLVELDINLTASWVSRYTDSVLRSPTRKPIKPRTQPHCASRRQEYGFRTAPDPPRRARIRNKLQIRIPPSLHNPLDSVTRGPRIEQNTAQVSHNAGTRGITDHTPNSTYGIHTERTARQQTRHVFLRQTYVLIGATRCWA